MPLSLILLLSTTQAVPDGHLGREAQAWFLKQIQSADPGLSKRLHDPADVKPYTVSDLFALPQSGDSHGARYALRLTAFSESLECCITEQLKHAAPEQIRLWYGELAIREVILDPARHPWAGSASFGDLIQAAHHARGSRFTLNFITPTGFRSDGADLPLPLPHLMFRGYWQKWNASAPQAMQMDEGLLGFIKDCLRVEALHDLNTGRIMLADGKRGGAVGFTGQVGLRLVRPARDGQWAADWPHYQEMVCALARFSFYCGTGHHTTIGLGQTYPSF